MKKEICEHCKKEIKGKNDLLIKPSIFWIVPKFPYTSYHSQCFKKAKTTKHGPITFYKDEKLHGGFFLYAFIVTILLLIGFWNIGPQTAIIIASLFLLFNIWILLKILKFTKN